jgi:TP901-1 family phage major tail protein
MSKKGVDILLSVDLGTEGAPSYTPVGGQRGVSISEARDTFETTNKLSPDQAREFESSFYAWTASLDGVHVAGEEAYEHLKTAVRSGSKIQVTIDDGGVKEVGTALVTSRDLDAPYDGESTYAVELQGSGMLKPLEEVTP